MPLPVSDTSPGADSIMTFLEGYRSLRMITDSTIETSALIPRFSKMLEIYSEIKEKTADLQLRAAPQYNIFQILGLQRSEVRTHSAFLRDLLSPTGNHGQGLLFLQSFLENCLRTFPDTFPSLPEFTIENASNWLVSSEEHTHLGRMDIVIQNPQEGFLCVVENKVDATEGWAQLERYGRWMREHHDVYPISVLCFLTIDGDISRTAGDFPYISLSYHHDIAGWLEGILDQIQAPGVLAVVHQYQAIAVSL